MRLQLNFKKLNQKLLIMNNQELKTRKIIDSLYERFKNTSNKLKIVCDWDEVIQSCEPYATWLSTNKKAAERYSIGNEYMWWARQFPNYFQNYWITKPPFIEYSSYGSKNKVDEYLLDRTDYKERMDRQIEIKNSPNFYQEAPFLTIADDLLKLIKEDKVENLMFLSSCKFFSDRDKYDDEIEYKRKYEIFEQTFGKLDNTHYKRGLNGEMMVRIAKEDKGKAIINMIISPFDGEKDERGKEWTSKVAWVDEQLRKGNKIDIVIDSNPRICGNISCLDALKNDNFNETKCSNCTMEDEKGELKPQISGLCPKCLRIIPIVCSPYYPAVESQHDHDILLLKTSVSELTKENFK